MTPAAPYEKSKFLGSGSEIPCRVSSDLHEWRNDGHAVSTQDSVKLKSLLRCSVPAARRTWGRRPFTLKKLECSKQAYAWIH